LPRANRREKLILAASIELPARLSNSCGLVKTPRDLENDRQPMFIDRKAIAGFRRLSAVARTTSSTRP